MVWWRNEPGGGGAAAIEVVAGMDLASGGPFAILERRCLSWGASVAPGAVHRSDRSACPLAAEAGTASYSARLG